MGTKRNRATKLDADKILSDYFDKFESYPAIPMMQCSGKDDPRYLKMLLYAIEKNRPVTEEDEDKFFPCYDGVRY